MAQLPYTLDARETFITQRECAHALYRLDYPRTITLRKV